jgi:hypothetical protein
MGVESWRERQSSSFFEPRQIIEDTSMIASSKKGREPEDYRAKTYKYKKRIKPI